MTNRTLAAVLLVLAGGGAAAAPPVAVENIVFPADAGVVDVTRPPYNAVPNDDKDDTAALQKALAEHPNQGAIIYLPSGIYVVTDTLRWPHGERGGAEEKNTVLQGQSRAGTILKVPDGCPGWNDPKQPRAMLWTGRAPAQRFGNEVRSLTIDTGSNNAGAIGMQFMANNQGCVRDVTIKSGDGRGVIGLDLGYTDENGPLLVKNVSVFGFDVGIRTASAVDSETFEHVRVENQNKTGWENYGQCVSVRDFASVNDVPALRNTGSGLVTLVNGTLRGQKPGPLPQPAIVNSAVLYARFISMLPEVVYDNRKDGRDGVYSNRLDEAWPFLVEEVSHPVLSLFPERPIEQKSGRPRGLNLPIRETPTVPWDDPKTWVSPARFGGLPDDDKDDTAAIQSAIDAGATTVYLPRGNYRIGATLHVRGKVRRIIGCKANLQIVAPLSGQAKPVFRVEAGTAPVVIMERLTTDFSGGPFFFLEHATPAPRTLVLSSVMINFQNAASYRNTPGAGPLFIEDVVGGDWQFRRQQVWARQFNVENDGTHVTNDGGTLWILGLKTERGGTLIASKNGAKTELLGGFCYTTTAGKRAPMFTSDDSSVSLTLGESWFNRDDSPYTVLVRETRNGVTKTLNKGDAPGRTGGSVLPLFAGF